MSLWILIVVAFIVTFVFWNDFRSWISNQLDTLWQLIQIHWPEFANWLQGIWERAEKAGRRYALILAIVTLLSFLLIVIALLFSGPTFKAIAFVFALSLIILVWLPAGVVLHLFGVEKGSIPKFLKTVIAWVAFIGFIAVAFPDEMNLKMLMTAALVGFIAFGAGAKMNVLDKIVLPMVMIMLIVLAWKHYYPDNFRSTTRFANSWGKRLNTTKDRKSIDNETDAATTYVVVLKDIDFLFEFDENNNIEDIIDKQIKRGTILRLISHKDEVRIYENQGFVNIQLPREKESFVGGPKYWVESEFVKTASPRDIIPKDDSLLPKNQQAEVGQGYFPRDSIFTKGVYFIDVNGETPFNINVVSDQICKKYALKSVTDNNYRIIYDDGICIDDGPGKEITADNREYPRFKLVEHNAKETTKVRLVVN